MALVGIRCEHEKVEVVGVFEDLLSQIGVRRGQRSLEVGQGFALPVVEMGFDLMLEDRPAPAVLVGGAE